MPKARKSNGRRRRTRFEEKYSHTVIPLRIKPQIPRMSSLLDRQLTILDELEKQVFASLEQGITEDYVQTRWMNWTSGLANMHLLALATTEVWDNTGEIYLDINVDTMQVGIRVWRADENGNDISEITGGTPVAVASTTLINVPHLISATWNCPETPLTSTDRIKIRIYHRLLLGAVVVVPWNEWDICEQHSYTPACIFITEPLGASKLSAATWTVYYSVMFWIAFAPTVIPAIFWNHTAYPTRIETFTWALTTPISSELWPFYMAFAKRAFHFHYNFDQPTATNEVTQLIEEFVKRGLNEEVLNQLAAIAKTKAELAKQG